MILDELQKYEWNKPRWTHEKFFAESPFRDDDSSPSFYVWLVDNARFNAKEGQFGDDGAPDEWKRGSFVKLLSFLRQETEEETREYLRYTYETEWTSEEEVTLNPPKLAVSTARKPFDIRLLDQYAYRHPYLAGRGISEAVQRAYRVGYDRSRQAVTIPWFLPDGRLANILYRSINSKVFWYEKGGWPIREMLYGMDVVYRRRAKRVGLCEAPIDALFLATCGVPAVAVGGTAFNEAKRDLIIRSPIEEVVLFTDNDVPGEGMKRKVIDMLNGYVDLREVTYPDGCKDPCDVGDPEVIREMAFESLQLN